MAIRNIITLTGCQLISATGAIVMVTLGGIIGSELTPDPTLATLPVSIMVLCMAATTIPATMLMRKIGRRKGFALASVSAASATLLAGFALYSHSFGIFILAGATFGINMAFTQQYRYAAAESVEPEHAPRAISYVLLGAIGGALLGPELVRYGQFALADVRYAGTLLSLTVLYFLQAGLFLSLGPLHGEEAGQVAARQRPLAEIVRQPTFVVAVLCGAVAYGIMTFVMTATPLSMHVHDGFSIDDTSGVIRSHVLGMYLPSLISGYLIERFGVLRLMGAGVLGLLGACLVGLQGHSYIHYWDALVLLGVGWNFLYVGGTSLLTRTYRVAERFRAQAVNEFCVFGMSATASLLAGTIIHLYGWFRLIVVPLPILLLAATALFLVRKDPLAARLRPEAA
jgi:MFS family permease